MSKKTVTIELTKTNENKISIEFKCDKDVFIADLIGVFDSLVEVHQKELQNYAEQNNIELESELRKVTYLDLKK